MKATAGVFAVLSLLRLVSVPIAAAAQLIIGIFPPAIPLRPATGNYRGDGKADIAVFRAESGLWAIR
ncbi:MAG: hypothetical protein P9M08_05135 [Candidatus Erginobacter occultus]|nr:hypothetical protein [Candidatus Erginobacter occultus]